MPDIPRKATTPPDLTILLEETGDHTDSQKLTIAKTLMVHVARHLEDQDHSVDAKFDNVREELMAVQRELAITRREIGTVSQTIAPVIDFTRALTRRYPQGIEVGWDEEDEQRALLWADRQKEREEEARREVKADIQHREQMEALSIQKAQGERFWNVAKASLAVLVVIALGIFGLTGTAALQSTGNAGLVLVAKASGAVLVVLVLASILAIWRTTPLDIKPVPRAAKRATDPPDVADVP